MVKETEATIVRALQAFVADVDGAAVPIYLGDLFEADHPLVRKQPQLFGPVLIRYPVVRDRPVEQATAVPGEKRNR
jgi:hypothetical protein